MKQTAKTKIATIVNILEEQHNIFTNIENGFCFKFTNLLNKQTRITPIYSFEILDISIEEWVREIKKSLTNFVQLAQNYNVVIREWKDVKFGHGQEVICSKKYEPDKNYHGGWMGESYHNSESHLIVGKNYKIIEASYNNQVYILNEFGKTMWYNESYFQAI